ncbi:TetR/AcrR family transcriptional regulator [Yinghuangia soli]|uniref:TetR/AcrR family transcriptional regulator n=1 Tax=Yinghuangia soli TaxID=2908204 RepID=UPI0027E270E7|nr:TetR/AcrR family transcriptional regulator [Yinghuangia soli]
MTTGKGARLDLIGDTAVHLLVERGMRGLTHRAVDEAAGLPSGSTSYYARTRAALLEVALARMTMREAGEFADAMGSDAAEAAGIQPPAGGPAGGPAASPSDLAALLPSDPDAVVDLLAGIVDAAIRDGRDQKIARYELALEATRRAELRGAYDEAGRAFREAAVGLLAAMGAQDPVRQGRSLVAWCEGMMFDAIAGSGWSAPPSRADIAAGMRELLAGILKSG